MVKRKTSATPKPVRAPRRARRYSPVTRTARRRLSTGFMGKIKWGEAALAALVGYEGGNLLDSTGLPTMLASNSKIGPYLYEQSLGAKTVDSGITYGKIINKDLGLVAGAKVVYDVVKHRKLEDMDLNILIPYVIGTAFDKTSPKGSSGGGDW